MQYSYEAGGPYAKATTQEFSPTTWQASLLEANEQLPSSRQTVLCGNAAARPRWGCRRRHAASGILQVARTWHGCSGLCGMHVGIRPLISKQLPSRPPKCCGTRPLALAHMRKRAPREVA